MSARKTKETFVAMDERTALSAAALKKTTLDHVIYSIGRYPAFASLHDYYMALAYAVRDRLLHRWVNTVQTLLRQDVKVACYLSAEFLIGPQLGNSLVNLGIEANAREAMAALGMDLDELLAMEEEPGLGNGGLGRLAACYLDSLASLEMPAIGYGIRYEFGIFDQQIRDGWQVEITEHRSPATASTPATSCACGSPKRWSPSTSKPSTWVTITRQ